MSDPEITFDPTEAAAVAEMLTNGSAGVAFTLTGVSDEGTHFGGALVVPADASSGDVLRLVASISSYFLAAIAGGLPDE